MATTTELRTILGDLAADVMPHLMGKPVNLVRGLTSITKATDADLAGHPLADTLKGYQRAGVAVTRHTDRVMFGHGMGLGKTIQAVASIMDRKSFPALVVCPPTLAVNWVREFAKWAPELRVARLVGRTPSAMPDADVWVIGDSVLQYWAETIIAAGPAALVVDESQRMKNRKAARTKAAIEISRKLPHDALVLLLTGTAIDKHHGELTSQLQILGVEHVFGQGGIFSFMDRYFPKADPHDQYSERISVDGEALFAEMIDTFYVRHTQADVRDQLGGLVVGDTLRKPVVVEFAGKAATEYRKVREAARGSERKNAMAQLGKLRKLAGEAKVAATVDYVLDLTDQDEQVIVFAWHRDVVDAIADKLTAKNLRVGKIYGGMKVDDVEAAKDRFQAGQDNVIILNITAGGTGHTLTAARHVVFAEYAWNSTDMDQCEARANRIGQTRDVVSHWLIGANGEQTIDERLIDILNRKALTTSTAIDGRTEIAIDVEEVTEALVDWLIAQKGEA